MTGYHGDCDHPDVAVVKGWVTVQAVCYQADQRWSDIELILMHPEQAWGSDVDLGYVLTDKNRISPGFWPRFAERRKSMRPVRETDFKLPDPPF